MRKGVIWVDSVCPWQSLSLGGLLKHFSSFTWCTQGLVEQGLVQLVWGLGVCLSQELSVSRCFSSPAALRSSSRLWAWQEVVQESGAVGGRGTGNEEALLKCGCVCAQLCPTLCDPIDGSLSGFSVHGILQAKILE